MVWVPLLWGRKPRTLSSVKTTKGQNCWVGLGLSSLDSRTGGLESDCRKSFLNCWHVQYSLDSRHVLCALVQETACAGRGNGRQLRGVYSSQLCWLQKPLYVRKMLLREHQRSGEYVCYHSPGPPPEQAGSRSSPLPPPVARPGHGWPPSLVALCRGSSSPLTLV